MALPEVPLRGPVRQGNMWRYPLVFPQLPLHPLVEMQMKVRDSSVY